MIFAQVFTPLVAFVACLASQPANLSRQVASLATERDPARLEAASVAVASSGSAQAIHKLGTHLGTRSFLRRLDPGKKGQLDIDRLVHVFAVLAEHPSAATEELCLGLAHNAEFLSLPERLNLVLNAIAAVRPTSSRAAAIFRESSHAGYFDVNGPLLARNASPLALAVLEELMSDETLEVQDRVGVAHRSLLPMRALGRCRDVRACRSLSGRGGSGADGDRGTPVRLSARAMVWRRHESAHAAALELSK